MQKILETLLSVISENNLVKAIFSDKRKKSIEYSRVVLRPVIIKGEVLYQAEYSYEKKAVHRNIPLYELQETVSQLMKNDFKQLNILTTCEDIQLLASDVENPRIKRKASNRLQPQLFHNRKKQYIIEEGVACDFLIKLGVMLPDGSIAKKHYSKFRQINRFLEIADDCFSQLPNDKMLRIIDFGCGKSYLTFALYYYIRKIKERDVEIIGLDLKKDVVKLCNNISTELGYHGLSFMVGDIADFEEENIDMVVTLHACDTATDYALINAVAWRSKVILSVPCCQHELFSQLDNDLHNPLLKYGIIRDKFTELLTDALRGLKLEEAGYHVDMIEFTSLEHTSKNIMIKCIKQSCPQRSNIVKAAEQYIKLKEYYNVTPTIGKMDEIISSN